MLAKIIKEDFVSSLTGGFYLDYSQNLIIDLIHLYTWLMFFTSPLVAYLVSFNPVVCWLVYSSLIVIIFLFVKLLAWKLNDILDTKEPIHESSNLDISDDRCKDIRKGKSGTSCHQLTEANVDDNVEDRCRRVGRAGLDMADLLEAAQNNQVIVPRLSCNVDSSNQILSENPDQAGDFSSDCFGVSHSNVSQSSSVPSKAITLPKVINDDCRCKMTSEISLNSADLSGKAEKETPIPVLDNDGGASWKSSRNAHFIMDAISCQPSVASPAPTTADSVYQVKLNEGRLRRSLRRRSLSSTNTLEALDLCSLSRESRTPRLHSRSSSQRNSVLPASQLRVPRRQMSAWSYIPPNVFPRRFFHLRDLIDFGLSDAIPFWRRNFVDSAAPHTRLERLCHPIHHTVSFTHPKRIGFSEWRSNSLRQTFMNPHHRSPPLVLRQSLRRPGSALRLRRLQSSESALSSTTCVQSTSKLEIKANVNHTPLVQESLASVSEPKAVSDAIRISSESPRMSRPNYLSDSNDDVSYDSCNREPTPCTSESERKPDSPLVRHRLVRQHGFRRNVPNFTRRSRPPQIHSLRDELSPPDIRVVRAGRDRHIVDECQSNVTSSVVVASNAEAMSPASACAIRSEASTSTENSIVSKDKTVDMLLAQLMGVPSLVDAGLTRERCLSHLRASGDADDSDNAELDILFAVSTATNVADGACDTLPVSCGSSLPQTGLLNDADCPVLPTVVPVNANHTESLNDRLTRTHSLASGSPDFSGSSSSRRSLRMSRRSFLWRTIKSVRKKSGPAMGLYRLQPFPCVNWSIRIRMNRLQLDSLFDRNRSSFEAVLSVLLALCVSSVGYFLLRTGSFRDFSLFLVCFTIASCHYSLLKSVQPDPASPQHGFNRVIVFSRSVFFSILAVVFILTVDPSSPINTFSLTNVHSSEVPIGLKVHLSHLNRAFLFSSGRILLHSFDLSSDKLYLQLAAPSQDFLPPKILESRLSPNVTLEDNTTVVLTIFGVHVSFDSLIALIHSVAFCLVIIYPFLFPFGLVPQLDTFFLYLLEQIELHVFGGSGTLSLLSAAFSMARNFIVLGCTFYFCYAALQTETNHKIWLSIFWSLQVSLCFLLSRLPSNLRLYVTLSPCLSPSNLCQACTSYLRFLLSRLRSLFEFDTKKQSSKPYSNVLCCGRICCSWFNEQKFKTPTSWWRHWLSSIPDVTKKSASLSKSVDLSVTERLLPSVDPEAQVACGQPISEHLALPSKKCLSSPELTKDVPDNSRVSRSTPHVFRLRNIRSTYPNLHALQADEQQCLLPLTISSDRLPHETEQIANDSAGSPGMSPTRGTFQHEEQCHPCSTHGDGGLDGARIMPRDSVQHDGGSDYRSAVSESSVSYSSKWTRKPSCSTDPLPALMRSVLLRRLQNDMIYCVLIAIFVFSLHVSPLFDLCCGVPLVAKVLVWLTISFGVLLHYLWPQLSKTYPWLLISRPVIPVSSDGNATKWEFSYYWLSWMERIFLLPAVILCTTACSSTKLTDKFGVLGATIIIQVSSMKMLRQGFTLSSTAKPFVILLFVEVLFTFDFPYLSESYPLNYWLMSVVLTKMFELAHKLHFVYVYTAPFRITWGSFTHCIVQIASVPHFLFMLANCLLSAVLSTPLEPFLASAIFIISRARPVKFWEVKHRTERMETTNTALASQMQGVSENQVQMNLNAIFYERLARNLQLSLAGDLQLGRLSGLNISHGDVLILSSDELNFLVHIIEVGNGLVSFQLRGLEFIGTYCHERETEVLRSSSHNDHGFCCCNPGHFPGMLSLNAALKMRSTTWQFLCSAYSVNGYRMCSPNAGTGLLLHELRSFLINRFLQCVVYYVLQLQDLPARLEKLVPILEANDFSSPSHFDLDPVFLKMVDEDFDDQVNGVTRRQFVKVYLKWIRFCLWKRPEVTSSVSFDPSSPLVSLCYALGLLGRRCIGGTVQGSEFHGSCNRILRGIHDVFKGDIRVMTKDEWVLADLELLQLVITPAMRIGLKLYQDYFLWASDLTYNTLYNKIKYAENNFVICHETDPQWRIAILNDAPSLFSLRLVGGGSDDTYRFIQLAKSKLQFSVVKINEECVRGLWASQQREQIFIRNNDFERGSIQGAQHILRNLVNSSCDPPIGYPIYVSPILTSFAGTNPQLIGIGGFEFSVAAVGRCLRRVFAWLCSRPLQAGNRKTDIPLEPLPRTPATVTVGSPWIRSSHSARSPSNAYLSREHERSDRWPSVSESNESIQLKKSRRRGSTHMTTLSALVHERRESDGLEVPGGSRVLDATTAVRVQIYDPTEILNDRIHKLIWPREEWRLRCLAQSACQLSMFSGLEGECIHRWTPSNPDPTCRSFCHRTIALIAFPNGPPPLDEHFIAVWEDKGLAALGTSSLPVFE